MAIHVNKSVFANGLHDLKSHLKGKGFKTKVILDDDTMEAASNIVRADKAYTLTPPDELRYIEGLLNLPFQPHRRIWCYTNRRVSRVRMREKAFSPRSDRDNLEARFSRGGPREEYHNRLR
jgi:hypothetical protein